MREVPATEFTRNFGQYPGNRQARAGGRDQPRPGHGVFRVRRRIRGDATPQTLARRSRAVADMTKEEMEQMAASRMAPEHDHLNALLDKE